MAKLTAKQRDQLPAKDFGLPGGRYPMENKKHASDAKGRATQQFDKGNLSKSQEAKVDAKANKVLGKKK